MSARARTTLLAGAGLLLLQLGWILALVPDFGIDEFDHALRASSVAEGHWQPGDDLVPDKFGRGDLIPVRADVARTAAPACKARPYTGIWNCTPKVGDLGHDQVLIASGASRYNPTYYLYAGVLASPFHGYANLIALRVVTALAACVLFMLTVWLAVSGSRTVWPVFACLAAALPTTVYSTSIASPNGIELIAGLGLWVAGLTLVRGPQGLQRRGSAYAVAMLCAAVLANTHTLGLGWIALIVITLGLLHGPGQAVRALLPRNRVESALALATASALSFEVVWLLLSGANDPSLEQSTFKGSPVPYLISGVVLWPLQAIGAFPMRNDPAPMIVFALALSVLVLFAVLVARRTTLRSRPALALGFIAVMSWIVPAALTAYSFRQIGSAWQGRYGMPFTVGLLVLGAAAIENSARQPRWTRNLVLGGAGGLVLAQLIGQVAVVSGQRSQHSLVAATGWPAPSTLLLIALAVLAAACWCFALTRPPLVPGAEELDEPLDVRLPAEALA